MNSKKVKEIKDALECCKQNEIEETCGYCLVCPASNWDYEKTCTIDLFQKALTLINELESKNERLNKAINNVQRSTKMTNEERIKSLSTEEFARFIADIVDCALCNNPIKCEGNYKAALEQWLKSEAKNGKV